jgi:predicted transcriptional regulator
MEKKAEISIVFRPSCDGLEKFFGKLEALIMETIWAHHPLTIKRAQYFLNKNHEYAYTTIMTVMNRLVEKKYLTRLKKGHSFSYAPTMSRDEFLELASERIINSLQQDFGRITARLMERGRKKKKPDK